MPSTATITAFYSFTTKTVIRSSEHNTNFGVFRGHLIAVDPNTSTAAATLTYDLGATDKYWRAGYIGLVNANTVSASSIVGTTITATSFLATTATVTTLVATSINATTIVATSLNASSVQATTLTGSSVVGVTVTASGVFNASGGQIKFPSTDIPSSDANTLDDYEEGSFTPTIRGTVTAGTGTYTTQVGKYTKIGNRVFFQLYVIWTNLTGQTGTLAVGGLPFTANATSNNYSAVSLGEVSNLTWTTNYILGAYVNINTNYMPLVQSISAAASSGVTVDTSGTLMITGHYEV